MALKWNPSLQLRRSFVLSIFAHGIFLVWFATLSVTQPASHLTRWIRVQIWDGTPKPAGDDGASSAGNWVAPHATQPLVAAENRKPTARRDPSSPSSARERRRPSSNKRTRGQQSSDPAAAARDPGDGAFSASGFGAGSALGSDVGPTAISGGGSADTVSQARQYLTALRARIEEHKRYPRKAQELGISGEVRVRFRIASDGGLLEVSIPFASHPLLAMAAREAVHRAAPFPPPPPGIERSFSLSLQFTLKHEESFG